MIYKTSNVKCLLIGRRAGHKSRMMLNGKRTKRQRGNLTILREKEAAFKQTYTYMRL